ncbi:MAG: carbon-nitrogen hydrolase family protein [Rhizobiales bacterium]|nr:carbon-nitrogen hydrolase family protein [Hyphomicrobiales bacterium]
MPVTCALLQLCSGRDVERNIAEASSLIRAAAAQGAQFVLTPEMTNVIEPDRPRLKSVVKPEDEDPGVAAFAACACELNVWLLIGSLALRGENGKLVNRSLLFAPDGQRLARYDKIHLFDVDLPTGERIRESEAYCGGQAAPIVATPWGGLGLTICYDVRFPALYRQLAQQGADFIAVPSAFTVPTGEAHWHVLLRARAVETGAYVLAPAQSGHHESGRRTYGHSLVVSPWGVIEADAGTEPGIVFAKLDRAAVDEARARIPAWREPDSAPLKAEKPVAS